MKELFFTAIAALIPILLLQWYIWLTHEPHNRPTDCSPEDVPIVDEIPEKLAVFVEYKHWINEVERKYLHGKTD